MKLSVIVPCYNEAKSIDLFLTSLMNSAMRQRSIEVILVDDGSDDETAGYIDKWSKRWDIIRFLRIKRNSGPSVARNLGASIASGRWLAFLDTDSVVEESWCGIALELLERTQGENIIGGKIHNLFDTMAPLQRALARIVKHKPRFAPHGEIVDLPCANLLVPALEFKRLGGFDEELRRGEDTNLIYRARKRGVNILFHDDLVVYHRIPGTFSMLFRSQVDYGGAFAQHVKRTGDGSLRIGFFGKSVVGSVWWNLWLVSSVLVFAFNIYTTIFLLAIYLCCPVRLLMVSAEQGLFRESDVKFLTFIGYAVKSWGYQAGFLYGFILGADEKKD